MTTTMHVLAIDPGPTWMGWARLQVEHGPGVRTTYVGGGEVPCIRAEFLELLREQDGVGYPDAVVIETPAGYAFNPGRVPQLLRTSFAAGGMAWIAESRDLRTVTPSAQQVRKVLAGKANADDGLVRDTVQRNVFGAIGITSAHVFDAVAAGLLGAWVIVGNAVLPDMNGGSSDGRRKKSGAAGKARNPRAR